MTFDFKQALAAEQAEKNRVQKERERQDTEIELGFQALLAGLKSISRHYPCSVETRSRTPLSEPSRVLSFQLGSQVFVKRTLFQSKVFYAYGDGFYIGVRTPGPKQYIIFKRPLYESLDWEVCLEAPSVDDVLSYWARIVLRIRPYLEASEKTHGVVWPRDEYWKLTLNK